MGALDDLIGASPTSPTINTPSSYGDTWSNRFGIATDQMQKSMYGGLGVIADNLDDYIPETAIALKEFAKAGERKELQQLYSRPQPTRSAEITEAWKDIKKEADEGDVLEAALRGGQWLHDATAVALPSLGVAGAALVGGTVIGGISDTVFSNFTLNTENLTFIMVSKQDVEDISGVGNQTLFKIEGDGGDTYANRFYFTKSAWGGSANDLYMTVYYGGTPTINLVPTTGGPLWTTEDRLITARTESGTNNTKIQVDNNTEITGTITASENFTLTTSAGKTSVSIGADVSYSLVPNTNYWGGRVYEVLLFNKTLSDTELTLVKNYINTKYALW